MTLYKKDNVYLRIIPDIDPVSPREWDTVGTMVTWHGRYRLGDEQPKIPPSEFLDSLPEDAVIIPLYLLDHSGLTLQTFPFTDRFDSGKLGYIYATRERGKELKLSRKEMVAALEGEVEAYNLYLQGEVYVYEKFELKICETCGHGHEEPLDGCWGFYGSDPEKNGLLESAGVKSLDGWKVVED